MRALAVVAGGLFCAAAHPNEFHAAARSGDIAKVQAMVSAGASVNERDALGGTPLHDAAWSGDLPMIEALLSAGADIEVRHNETGSTPLHYAVITNHEKAVKLLLDRK